jgi:hypothetical protein
MPTARPTQSGDQKGHLTGLGASPIYTARNLKNYKYNNMGIPFNLTVGFLFLTINRYLFALFI